MSEEMNTIPCVYIMPSERKQLLTHERTVFINNGEPRGKFNHLLYIDTRCVQEHGTVKLANQSLVATMEVEDREQPSCPLRRLCILKRYTA